MSEWHFVRPLWLLLLPVLPLLVFMYRRRRLGGGRWRDCVDPALAPFVLTGAGEPRGGKMLSVLITLIGAVLITALAGPVRERLPQPVYRSEAALVIALDLSRSMNARDVLPSRLERARYKIRDLLDRRVEGETALIAFAGDAFPVTPLTDDTATIAALLGSLTTDIMPRQGSLLTPALARAQRLLQQAGATRGHVLLVTDGVADQAEAVTAATTLAAQDITVSVLAVGTRDGDVVRDAGGDLVKDRRGQIVIAGLDVAALAAVSAAGNGRIVTLSVDDADVDTLLASAEDLLPGGRLRDDLQADVWKEEGPLLVLLCLPLVALAFRRGWIACVAVVFVLPPPTASAGIWTDLWTRRDVQAAREFEQQDYEEAAELFEDPRWQAAAAYRAGDYARSAAALSGLDDADAHYNRGNALARAGDIEAAIAAYQAALEREPQHEDARYNLELLQQQQQEQQLQQNQDANQDSQQDEGQDGQQPQSADSGGSESDSDDGSEGQQQSESGDASSAQGDPGDGDPASQPETQPGDEQNGEQEQRQAEAEDGQSEQGEQQAAALGDGEQERDFAAEQWLNQVPDDPGGLLRRKFARQYQQRYQDQPKEEQQW